MAKEVIIDPRYLKYSKDEVENLLGKVENELVPATEEDVRNVVRNYTPDVEPEMVVGE